MIQPTAPTAPAPAVTAVAIVAAQPGESAETGDFAALLSIQTLTVEQAPDAATEDLVIVDDHHLNARLHHLALQ